MPYVYSTATNSVKFNIFEDNSKIKEDDHRPRKIRKSITIEGGANVLTIRLLETPRGVVTSVTDEELELLEKDPTFIQMEKDGFFKVDNRKQDADKAVANLQPKDASAPLTVENFRHEGAPKPVVNKKASNILL